MHWSVFVLLGATFNVLVNLGYKALAEKVDLFLLNAVVYASALVTFVLMAALRGAGPAQLARVDLVIPVAMGVGGAVTMYLFVTALSRGPLSLVDPAWACVYALASAVVGLALLREQPSPTALAGIGLYLAGAFLMARG